MKKTLMFVLAIFSLMIPKQGETSQVVQNNACWIKECQGDRLYINADMLEIREDNILVKDANNILFPLTHVFVDSFGIFTTAHSVGEAELSTVWNIVWCKTCNAYRAITIEGLCGRCGNRP